jgi:hypothetical protein
MAFTNSAIKYLDGEKLFKVYWIDMGGPREFGGAASFAKMVRWCKANKMTHPVLGTVGRMGIWKCMWRWGVNNPEEAYRLAQKGVSQNGGFITPERWKEELLPKVKTSYQHNNFTKRWVKEHAN